jgi:hypothetical protein
VQIQRTVRLSAVQEDRDRRNRDVRVTNVNSSTCHQVVSTSPFANQLTTIPHRHQNAIHEPIGTSLLHSAKSHGLVL